MELLVYFRGGEGADRTEPISFSVSASVTFFFSIWDRDGDRDKGRDRERDVRTETLKRGGSIDPP